MLLPDVKNKALYVYVSCVLQKRGGFYLPGAAAGVQSCRRGVNEMAGWEKRASASASAQLQWTGPGNRPAESQCEWWI